MSTQILLRGRNGISLRNVLRRRPELKRTCTRCFSTTPQEETEESDITSKVLFNSTIPFKYSPKTFAKHRRDKLAHYKIKVETPVIPVSLKYYLSDPTDQEAVKNDEVPEQTQTIYPYALARQNVAVSEENETVDHRESPCEDNPREGNLARSSRKWMNDYERYCGPIEEKEEEDEEDSEFWQQDYGTSDSSVPVSSVPCGGCGALLHCQDQSIPGFLPSEIFKECRVSDLRSLVCQRCYFLNKYNTALSVIVDEESYPKMISKIREERALVILMVDLTDFPCSVWPDIFDLIGKKKPVIIVGNKIDLLWGDKKGWSQRLEKKLQHFIPANVNVMGLRLISAKTGYGVEELITLLHKVWSHKGDVYLIGCTNVGKSTLFNVLLQSDYCKVKARDLVQRATTSPWPGTTLNLLKFPILRPEGWRLFLRTNRLKSDRARASAERALFKEQMARSKGKNLAPLQLIGRVGQTVEPRREVNEEIFDAASTHEIDKTAAPQSGINPTDPQYKMSRWLYDTPGVIHRDQILDLLTAEELIKVIPRKPTVPRTFLIKPGWTVFIAGLSRLDYIEGTSPSRWTIFSSDRLPITVCHTADAQDVYQKFAGTERMSVPIGGESRMKDWPQLKSSSDYIKFCGVGLDESCGDVVLSSTGWIAVSLNKKEIGVFRAWTPDARGIHSRCPAFLPFAVRQRGEKLAHSPAYGKSRPFLLAY